jgi:CHAD domain-containing protein
MAVEREQSRGHINRHLTEWFKALEANRERAIERRCKELLDGKNKLTKENISEFLECMLKVKKNTWDNYLRRCRDVKYEKDRERISIRKSTNDQLNQLKEKLSIDSSDKLIVKLIDAYKQIHSTKKTLTKSMKKV